MLSALPLCLLRPPRIDVTRNELRRLDELLISLALEACTTPPEPCGAVTSRQAIDLFVEHTSEGCTLVLVTPLCADAHSESLVNTRQLLTRRTRGRMRSCAVIIGVAGLAYTCRIVCRHVGRQHEQQRVPLGSEDVHLCTRMQQGSVNHLQHIRGDLDNLAGGEDGHKSGWEGVRGLKARQRALCGVAAAHELRAREGCLLLCV